MGELAQTDEAGKPGASAGTNSAPAADIGSGPGFSENRQARGWNVIGIEPSRQAAAHARSLGIEVVEGFFDADIVPVLGRFDAVNLNNVLEHVPDPIAILLRAGALLEPGGVICVNVPNDFSPFQVAAAATGETGEWWIAPPHHLNYFDFATLSNLLERLKFEVAEKTTSFPMEAFLLMGDNCPSIRRSDAPANNGEIRSRAGKCPVSRKRASLLSRPGRNRHRARSCYHRGQALSDSTQPFFIVTSGRSGTALLHKALSADADMHHEYMVQIAQPLGVRRYLDLIDSQKALKILTETHAAAIGYSAASHWGDSSNKLSWLIPELATLLPDAKFVHLVRDGRKVAGSYFRKLGDECYDDRSTRILEHYDDPSHSPAPPRRKYWWPVPRRATQSRVRSFSQLSGFAGTGPGSIA
jgi:SAM-dependent methyltransferase